MLLQRDVLVSARRGEVGVAAVVIIDIVILSGVVIVLAMVIMRIAMRILLLMMVSIWRKG